MSRIERVDVYYRGRVQGVGFRFTTCHVARRHDVTGFVENLRDGRVRLIAEGERRILDAFITDVDEAMAGYIQQRAVEKTEATGEFANFGVRG